MFFKNSTFIKLQSSTKDDIGATYFLPILSILNKAGMKSNRFSQVVVRTNILCNGIINQHPRSTWIILCEIKQALSKALHKASLESQLSSLWQFWIHRLDWNEFYHYQKWHSMQITVATLNLPWKLQHNGR